MTIHVLSIKTVSEMNARCHWRVRDRRREEQRQAVAAHMRTIRRRPIPPLVVTLTRFVYRKKVLDDDNLRSALKYVRDAVAEELGIDDGNCEKIQWRYDQRENGNEHGVEIAITPSGAME